ncbi:Hypothetical predicted protein [Mytilus galloprovincialis]|uniref:Uncharacterized protein n=1 Tax=Mytilus galloprovincialis TaxID=29158 RepID=A0A8B6H569_MYTGA|nr:Hypothetical predicted protein [Mytilus galloprovincialis]
MGITIPNPHVNGYQNHKPAPQANGYQNHVPGLQVNGYKEHIPNPNSNGYKNHIPGPHGNGCHITIHQVLMLIPVVTLIKYIINSVVTQDLDYTTVEIEDKIIHHEQITSEDSETSKELKSVSDQSVVSTPLVIAAADIEPLLVTGNDKQEEHFLRVTKPQKDLG